ncbi:MAG: M14 family zinc carboxypeptidase, partial [Gemmatimonadaceae bacterium]
MRVSSITVALALVLSLPAPAHAQSKKVPTPASVIGFEPGTDRKLPEWRQVVAYFKALDAASPRVQLRVLGKTTLGRPFIAAFISDSATLANLPKVHEAQRKLADPRTTTEAERTALERDGKVVVLVTSSIHSTEVGGILTPLTLAYRLATAEDPEAKSI